MKQLNLHFISFIDVQTGETETSMETGDQPADVGADSCVPEGDRYVLFHVITGDIW